MGIRQWIRAVLAGPSSPARQEAVSPATAVRSPVPDANVPPLDLQRVFSSGEQFKDGDETISIEVREIAGLRLATGKIVACDPLVSPEQRPFTRVVPAGLYPVELSIAHLPPNGAEFIAAARVRLGSGSPVRWEHALCGDQQLEELEPGTFFGYGVDAGLGCFMDETAAALLLKAPTALKEDENYYDDVLSAELDDDDERVRDWTSHLPDRSRDDNVVVFSSGFGDGVYSSWWRLADGGSPICLVTDFAAFGTTASSAG